MASTSVDDHSRDEPDLDPEGMVRADRLAPLRAAALEPRVDWAVRLRSLFDEVRGGGPARWLAVAVVALLVAVGAALYLVRPASSGGSGPDPAASLPFARSAGTTPSGAGSTSDTGVAGPTPTTVAAQIVVQAAGAVVQPGVYRLAAGARVADLVAAAGGLTPDGDPDRVNLASLLVDGARVYLPHRGEVTPPAPVSDGGGGSAGGSASSAPPAPVDLNTATADELDTLPGIGPATAAAILDYRQRHGPFRSVDDLAQVRGIGDAKLAQLRDRVRV